MPKLRSRVRPFSGRLKRLTEETGEEKQNYLPYSMNINLMNGFIKAQAAGQ